MRFLLSARLLALVALMVVAGFASADFAIQNRWVTVRIGPGVGVEVRPNGVTPLVNVEVGGRAPVPMMPREENLPVQPPPGVPLEVSPPAKAVPLPGAREAGNPGGRVPTIQEFAASFKAAPGNYEVVVMHPYTNCPVKVCFNLPQGCPKVCVKGVLRRCVEFDYGKCEVQVWFYRDGRVKVDY